jgi:hypothetical protein
MDENQALMQKMIAMGDQDHEAAKAWWRGLSMQEKMLHLDLLMQFTTQALALPEHPGAAVLLNVAKAANAYFGILIQETEVPE